MSQNYPTVTGTSDTLAAFQDAVAQFLASLRSSGHGGSAPTGPVTGQPWYDGSDLRIYDGTSWVLVAAARQLQTIKGAIDGTSDGVALFYAVKAGTVSRVRLLPNASVALDGGNFFSVQVHNVTQSQDLFSAAPGTDTESWTAGTVKDYTPDQNQAVAEDDILRITISGTGSPTALNELGVELTTQHT